MTDSLEVIARMKQMADKIAVLADECAERWKDMPGDVALHMFAETIRQTNKATEPSVPVAH